MLDTGTNTSAQAERLKQVQAMEKALKQFRQQQETEKSEFAAEFGRLSRTDSRLAAFGLLESVSLTALLLACESALRAADLEFLWLQERGNGWAAACLQGNSEDLEQAMAKAGTAGKRLGEPLLAQMFKDPPLVLRRWFLTQGTLAALAGVGGENMQLKDADKVREQLAGRVQLQNAVSLLEYTDAELRSLIRQQLPDEDKLTRSRLNSMHKEELVDFYNQLNHGQVPVLN